MAGPEFHRTPRGRVLLDEHVPCIADALARIATALEALVGERPFEAEMTDAVLRIIGDGDAEHDPIDPPTEPRSRP